MSHVVYVVSKNLESYSSFTFLEMPIQPKNQGYQTPLKIDYGYHVYIIL